MRRAIVPLAIVLALVTGVVLHATQIVVLAPAVAPAIDSRAGAHAVLIRRFYAAVNDTLATGSAIGLDDVLDADFIDHAAPSALPLARKDFTRSLLTLRQVAPALRLEVLDIVVQLDRIAATVRAEGAEGATFLGIPVSAASLWGATDLFRIESGRIADRWGDPTGLAFFSPLLSVGISVEEPLEEAITLERWTYAPGSVEVRAGSLGFVVLLAESGALTVQVTPGAYAAGANGVGPSGPDGPMSATPQPPEVLQPGDAVVVTADGRIDIRNEGPTPAVVLAIVATVPLPSKGSVMESIGPPTGIEHAVLAGGPATDLPFGEATIAIGRTVLAPGTRLPSHTVAGPEFALVEMGTLALADGGRAWVTKLPNAVPRRSNEGPLPAGAGVRVDRGSVVGYHNAGDNHLALLLITVFPIPARPEPTPHDLLA